MIVINTDANEYQSALVHRKKSVRNKTNWKIERIEGEYVGPIARKDVTYEEQMAGKTAN